MTLLSIFNTGGLTLVLSIIAFGLMGWLGYQTWVASKSGGKRQTPQGTTVYDNNKTPFYKIPQFWLAVVVLIFYIWALLAISSDYKGV